MFLICLYHIDLFFNIAFEHLALDFYILYYK